MQRDAEADIRIGPLIQAIDNALQAALKERDALRMRVGTARDLAALVAASDEYLTPEYQRASSLTHYEDQMSVGKERLQVLDQQISGLAAPARSFTTVFRNIRGRP